TSANNATFIVGALGSFTVTATGLPTTMTFSETGALPNGVTLNSSTGVLSGTPTAGTAGAYSITLIANNGVTPNGTQSFTLTVASAPVLLPRTTGNPEDNVTTSTTPSFYGTTTGSITTVTIYSDGLQVGSGSASNYANNTVGVSVTTPLSVGTHVITAKATD